MARNEPGTSRAPTMNDRDSDKEGNGHAELSTRSSNP